MSHMILGIDEAGRGPWAGPLVVGAVVLGGAQIEGLTDSKKLSKKKRQQVYDQVVEQAVAYASGWVSASELDEIGMSQALRLATRRAVEQIKVPYSEIIIDGTINFLSGTGKGYYVQTMPKADLLVPSVSAASIIAKVERDRYMTELGERHPEYGFGSHAGYGVAKHRQAIDELGAISEHRLSFAPLAKYRNNQSTESDANRSQRRDTTRQEADKVTTKSIGDKAEDVVADFLKTKGHVIIERNWRTKFCEIDIVSQKDDTVYFTEVKYRKNTQQGGGFAAITKTKLRQMKFAAEYFALKNELKDTNLRLGAAEVSGDDFQMAEWLKL